MANFISSGADEVIRQLEQADLFGDEAASRLLDAGAELFVANVQKEMRAAPYRLGSLLEKVKRKGGKLRRDAQGRPYVTVTVNGTNKRGERNATVAFVLNYGRAEKFGRIEPAHFWTRAKQTTAEQIPDAYAEVVRDIYQERGLS